MHAVGSACHDQIRPVVEYQQGAEALTHPLEAPRGDHDFLVGPLLHAELDQIDSSCKRGVQKLVGLPIANEVEPGSLEALEPVVHPPSLARLTRYDRLRALSNHHATGNWQDRAF